MRKKSGLIIVEQAIVLVPEFERVVRKLERLPCASKAKVHLGGVIE